MWRIRESILESKLTYQTERLFNSTVLKAIYKSFIAMVKCLMDLIKPHKTKDIF